MILRSITPYHIILYDIISYRTGLDCAEVPVTDPAVTADELLPIILRAFASLLRRRSTERGREKRREDKKRKCRRKENKREESRRKSNGRED